MMKHLFLALMILATTVFGADQIEQQFLSYENIIRNPGFESGSAKWTATGGTFAIIFSGSYLAKGKATASWDASAAGQYVNSAAVAIPNYLKGRSCLARVLFNTTESSNPYVFQVDDGLGGIYGSRLLYATGGYFTTETITFTCPVSGNLRAQVKAQGNAALIYFDDVVLTENYIQQLEMAVGTLYPYPVPTATGCPKGSLEAVGTAVSRAHYVDLFNKLCPSGSCVWGTGDGSTTFNIPDMRGRGVIGDGTGPANYNGDTNPTLTARTVGGALGRETHTLALTEIPSHAHGGSSGTVYTSYEYTGQHVESTSCSAWGSYMVNDYGFACSNDHIYAQADAANDCDNNWSGPLSLGCSIGVSLHDPTHRHNFSYTVNPDGGGLAHNNMKPVAVTKWCIKY